MKKHSAVVNFGGGNGYTSSSAIRYIKGALTEQAARFEQLVGELIAFRPKSFDEILAKVKEDFAKAKQFNTPDKWEAMVHGQATGRAKPQTQCFLAFHDRFFASCVTTVTLTAALCEAAANSICAIHSTMNGKPEIFENFERDDLKTKWVSGMNLVLPNYKFDKSGRLYETLDRMITLRNSYLHHKIGIWSSDQKTSLEGSKTPEMNMGESGVNMLRRILQLPTELVNNLIGQTADDGQKLQFSMILG